MTPLPGTITLQATAATQSIQHRGGADPTAEEASRLLSPTVPGGGGGVNIAVRTVTPTFGPTNVPTQVKARSTVSVRNSAPGEIGAGKISEGPAR
jgi:hypothetical protein